MGIMANREVEVKLIHQIRFKLNIYLNSTAGTVPFFFTIDFNFSITPMFSPALTLHDYAFTEDDFLIDAFAFLSVSLNTSISTGFCR